MLREDNIPIKDYFNIWFNREKRKEFYTTSISLYKTMDCQPFFKQFL